MYKVGGEQFRFVRAWIEWNASQRCKKVGFVKNKWHEKRMYGQFLHEMPEQIDKNLSWKWLVQSDLKVQTETTICAAQEQALRTIYTKNKIDKTLENP